MKELNRKINTVVETNDLGEIHFYHNKGKWQAIMKSGKELEMFDTHMECLENMVFEDENKVKKEDCEVVYTFNIHHIGKYDPYEKYYYKDGNLYETGHVGGLVYIGKPLKHKVYYKKSHKPHMGKLVKKYMEHTKELSEVVKKRHKVQTEMSEYGLTGEDLEK